MTDTESHNIDYSTLLAEATLDVSEHLDVDVAGLLERLQLPEGERFDQLLNVEFVGRGGVGQVFEVDDPLLKRRVAIKVLNPDGRNRGLSVNNLVREARTTARIDHPNIVPVHRMGYFEDVGVYFTMRKVEGRTLFSVLKALDDKQGAVAQQYSLRRRLEIFVSVCQGVAFAHTKGVLHCDLKPANIMLGEYGEVLVMDWGLMRLNPLTAPSAAEGAEELSPEEVELRNKLAGTPSYLAPELITASQEPDVMTDVYSLGVVLYAILTCKSSPYTEQNDVNVIMNQAVNGQFLSPRRRTPQYKIPRELEAICLKAMAKRDKRYATVDDLLHDVQNYLDRYPVQAFSPSIWYRMVKLCRRRPLVPLVLAVSLLIGLLVVCGVAVVQYMQFTSWMESAEGHIQHGNRQVLLANAALFRYKEAIRNGDLAGAQRIEKQVRFYNAEFNNSYVVAADFLGRAELYSWFPSVKLAELYGDLYLYRLLFALSSDNKNELRRIVQQFNQHMPSLTTEIIKGNSELGRRALLLQKNQGRIEMQAFPMQPVELEFTWLEQAPLKDAERSQKIVAPFRQDLQAGLYLITLPYDEKRDLNAVLDVVCTEDSSVSLYVPPQIPDKMVYVPLLRGNDEGQYGFFIKETEVTVGEYLEFWRQLPAAERKTYLPHFSPDPASPANAPLWDENGVLADEISSDMPITGITGKAAEEYCRYMTKKLGLFCRLPSMAEWEEASREAPWKHDGSAISEEEDDILALTADNPDAKLWPHGNKVGSYPDDVSLYGVHDMRGNVREFVRTQGDDGALYSIKGASFMVDERWLASGVVTSSNSSENDVGFRFVAEVETNNEQ